MFQETPSGKLFIHPNCRPDVAYAIGWFIAKCVMQNMALRIRVSKLLISCTIDNVYTLQDIEDYSQQTADDIRMIE